MSSPPLVIVESPFAGNIERNLHYARAALFDSFERGEIPFASHLIYPQVLDDNNEEHRRLGILAGFRWGKYADIIAVYTDLGWSDGMRKAVTHYRSKGVEIDCRQVPNWK